MVRGEVEKLSLSSEPNDKRFYRLILRGIRIWSSERLGQETPIFGGGGLLRITRKKNLAVLICHLEKGVVKLLPLNFPREREKERNYVQLYCIHIADAFVGFLGGIFGKWSMVYFSREIGCAWVSLSCCRTSLPPLENWKKCLSKYWGLYIYISDIFEDKYNLSSFLFQVRNEICIYRLYFFLKSCVCKQVSSLAFK